MFYMSTTAATVGVSVTMLWLDNTRHVAPPPEWLRFLVYNFCARIICYGKVCGTVRFKRRSEEDEEILKQQMDREKGVLGDLKSDAPPGGIAASALVELAKVASASTTLDDLETPPPSPTATKKTVKDPSVSKPAQVSPEAKEHLSALTKNTILQHLLKMVKKEAKAKSIDRIKEEWTEINKIVNAFVFCVLLTFTVAFILMCIVLWSIVD